MFKNAIIFRINDDWEAPSLVALQEALEMAKFAPCAPTQRESFGWVEPRGEQHGPLVESIGGELIFKMKTESKLLPAAVVNEHLEALCKKVEDETGRKPGSKAKKELKEQAEHELLSRAFTKSGATLMWVSPKGKFIVIDAGSVSKADRLTNQLIEALSRIGNSITLRTVQTKTAPATAMALWLTEMEAPTGFSVDRDCELKAPDGEKSTVRYARHPLELDEVVEHIKVQGKIPTKLAMTHDSRVSFVLTDDLSLKKVEILDVVLEGAKAEDSGFDADVAMVTGELSKLIPNLIEVLDGEMLLGDHAADSASDAKAVPAESHDSGIPDATGVAPWESGDDAAPAEVGAPAEEVA